MESSFDRVKCWPGSYQDGSHVYTVKIGNRPGHLEDVDYIVKNVPRHAILFLDQPYTSHQHFLKPFAMRLASQVMMWMKCGQMSGWIWLDVFDTLTMFFGSLNK